MERKPAIYTFFHSKMMEINGNYENCFDQKKIKRILGVYGIPSYLWNKIIKEMEDLNMLERINKQKIRVKR